MRKEVYNQRILIADNNKYLYNEKDNIISDKVYLGINANETDWVEITEEQKQQIDVELNNE